MNLQNCLLTGAILMLTATSSWAEGPDTLTSPALMAYLFIYTFILAIAGVLVGGLWLAGSKEHSRSDHHQPPLRPHLNPTGQYRTGSDIDLEAASGVSVRR